MIRLLGEEAAYPHAEFLKDWAADPFTSTSRDLALTRRAFCTTRQRK
ncbi:hypothetical protein LNQ03_30650 [Klebsiella pneumoniae subsp. pneumoniae]|nr:hypothetical protein [Klebsiella pneumoniae subsp. pneumoniae]